MTSGIAIPAAVAVAAVGAGRYPPAPAAVERLTAALRAAPTLRQTLGGCLVSRRGAWLRVEREARPGRPPPFAAGPAFLAAPFAALLLEGPAFLCKIREAVSGPHRPAGPPGGRVETVDRRRCRPSGEGPVP